MFFDGRPRDQFGHSHTSLVKLEEQKVFTSDLETNAASLQTQQESVSSVWTFETAVSSNS